MRFLFILLAAASALIAFILFSGIEEDKIRVAAAPGCSGENLSGLWENFSSRAQAGVLGTASGDERWIEVDLSEQKLRGWEGNNLFLETLVSTGLPGTPTPVGEFRVWIKLRATKMEGGQGRNYYYLPGVPYVMYFENGQVPGYRGYGLHGTYWHNDFGRPKSHGCVNLPTPMAERIFDWARVADSNSEGTRIVIHE